ncbi:MAG: pyridoxal phosphate-dependent aminotransferase [Planctomycetota bacterium]|nr:pyridoxal phosphate-dependent aminotransferase [Planctomycetota bacterium]
MPRCPDLVPRFTPLGVASFSRLAHRMYSCSGPTYPLHIGDTWMEPATGCRMEDLKVEEHPGMHRYAPVGGVPALRDAILEKTRSGEDLPAERENVLITAGATGGLSAVLMTLLDPGDEVLVLAPYWPLIVNSVEVVGGRAVAVPFFETSHDANSAVETVERYRTEATVAIYWNTPHNPTGRLLPRDWLAALSDWACKKDLWILSDEVYENYSYAGPHVYSRPMAPERTVAAYSFSKAYGMAGNRCGYVVGPAEIVRAALGVTRNTVYSISTAAQLSALSCLQGKADAWVAQASRQYRELGEAAAKRLGTSPPEGSTFLFLDVKDSLDDRGLEGWLADCADDGLLVAPGMSFGPYPTHIRVCFTCVEPKRVEEGVEKLATHLGR